jgi:hypothetical protein
LARRREFLLLRMPESDLLRFGRGHREKIPALEGNEGDSFEEAR